MARDSFYGVPLPPNEEVGRSPCPLPGRCYLVAPSLMFHLAVGFLCRSGVSQPLPSIRTYARRACCCFGGCPLSPRLIRGSPPLPRLQAFREDHVLLLGGDPPPLLHLLVARWRSTLTGRGFPPLSSGQRRSSDLLYRELKHELSV